MTREQKWNRAFALLSAIRIILYTGIGNWGEGKPAHNVLAYLSREHNAVARELNVEEVPALW